MTMTKRRPSKPKTKPQATAPPPPAASEPTVVNDVPASRCPRCKSTRRAPYHHITNQQLPDRIGRDGEPVNVLVRKRTECLDCGQCRVDRFEMFETDTD